jgi:hypothetical protein
VICRNPLLRRQIREHVPLGVVLSAHRSSLAGFAPFYLDAFKPGSFSATC